MRRLRSLKHPFCAVSHSLGALLSLPGAVYLVLQAHTRPILMGAFLVYGFALVGLYVASSLYHSIPGVGSRERLLRNFDHTGIFLLIAGTYVPVCAVALPQRIGLPMMLMQGLCAAVGIVSTFTLKRFPSVLNVVLYLVMGWMAIFAIGYIGSSWPAFATRLLVGGGVIYTIGAVIFAVDKPHLVPGKFSAHDLWHLFVLGGSACHFALMSTYIAHFGN